MSTEDRPKAGRLERRREKKRAKEERTGPTPEAVREQRPRSGAPPKRTSWKDDGVPPGPITPF